MTLAELLLTITMPRRRLGRAEIQRRWKNRNRPQFNKYRRAWRQARREKGLPVT